MGLGKYIKNEIIEVPNDYKDLVEKLITINNRLYKRRLEDKG